MVHPTPDELRARFATAGQSALAEELIAGARNGIAIEAKEIKGDAAPGASKFGGIPDLPPDLKWPTFKKRPLAFLAQFNLAELPRPEGEPGLPAEGLLSFFYDFQEQPWGFDPKDRGGAAVFYSPRADGLVRTAPPAGAYAETESEDDKPFPAHTLKFKIVGTYPVPGNAIYDQEDAEKLVELVSELHEGQGDEHPRHQLLGHALVVQNPMEEECQLVSNGIYCGDELSAKEQKRAEKLAAGIPDWTLLFQLDSDSHWMWGDMGLLYFWIRRQDLAARDFSKIWCILQCT